MTDSRPTTPAAVAASPATPATSTQQAVQSVQIAAPPPQWASQADALGIVRVVLRHDGRLNAMSRAMWRQLRSVFLAIAQDPAARCVLIEGHGQAFCAGGDISEYPGFRFQPDSLRDFHENDVWGGLSAMLECDVPIVACIAGACMGAGVEIASCCDVRIAADDARFGAPIARLGFPMAPREAALVSQAVGAVTARQMLLEAASFSAAQMAERGFLSQVVAPQECSAQAWASAQRIASLAPQAARLNKQTLRLLGDAEYAQKYLSNRPPTLTQQGQAASNHEAVTCAAPDPYAYADSAEHREGITAFLAKRPPRF